METQVTINLTSVIFGVFTIIVSIFGYFIVRMVKGYDSQIKELFERTRSLPGIETDIEWLKEECKKVKKQ